MEALLIDEFREVEDPNIDEGWVKRVKAVELGIGDGEFDSKFFGVHIFLK